MWWVRCSLSHRLNSEAGYRKLLLKHLARNSKPSPFAEGVEKPTDLQVGMKLPGIITNVAAFGAFCDIGVDQDDLIHVSQFADNFIKDADDVVKVGQPSMSQSWTGACQETASPSA